MVKIKNIWENLKVNNKKILALAPLAGVTDSAFRQVCKEYGADIVYSEMASVDALVFSPKKTIELLEYNKNEKPYIVQLFGSNPKYFEKAVAVVEKEIEPDGFDVNFGCPVRKIIKQGSGAALMANIERSREVLKSIITSTDLPVSIKTRTSSMGISVEKFLDSISDLEIKTLMIHGRSLEQGFQGEIDYELINRLKNIFPGVILANGGINSLKDYLDLMVRVDVDGVGLARGALGRPWLFQEIKNTSLIEKASNEIFKIALRQLKLSEKLKGRVGVIEMRKHLCWYVQGLSGARELRSKLVRIENIADAKQIFSEYKENKEFIKTI